MAAGWPTEENDRMAEKGKGGVSREVLLRERLGRFYRRGESGKGNFRAMAPDNSPSPPEHGMLWTAVFPVGQTLKVVPLGEAGLYDKFSAPSSHHFSSPKVVMLWPIDWARVRSRRL